MAPRRGRLTGPAKRPAGRGRGREGAAPILAVSGPSGVGKTRLLVRLIPELVGLGLRVVVVKHTSHPHRFDGAGKDTARVRRAGAMAAAITGPRETAWFGPPIRDVQALAGCLPAADLVLAEGFGREPLPRIEVHRGRIDRAFLCARDPGVVAVVTDEPPPRPLPVFDPGDAAGLARFVARWVRVGKRPRRGVGR